MPPGRAASRAASKNSRVKSAATPAIHGLDGSETITSYWRGVSSRCDGRRRRSGATADRASASLVLARRRTRDASTTSGEISTTSARSIGCVSADASVTPLPRPMMASASAVRVKQQRQVREQLLRQHVAAVRRVDLAVDRERARAATVAR